MKCSNDANSEDIPPPPGVMYDCVVDACKFTLRLLVLHLGLDPKALYKATLKQMVNDQEGEPVSHADSAVEVIKGIVCEDHFEGANGSRMVLKACVDKKRRAVSYMSPDQVKVLFECVTSLTREDDENTIFEATRRFRVKVGPKKKQPRRKIGSFVATEAESRKRKRGRSTD